MIKFIMMAAKLAVLAVVIMLISQIPVGQKRICDHVADITQSRFVTGPVLWISDRFDFSDGRKAGAKGDRALAKRNARGSSPASKPANESDSDRLSGLLKMR